LTQRLFQTFGILETLVRLLVETSQDHRLKVGGQVRMVAVRRDERLGRRLHDGAADERRLSCQQEAGVGRRSRLQATQKLLARSKRATGLPDRWVSALLTNRPGVR
jgi:hypothetical protein